MQGIPAILPVLLSDERSAVKRKAAVLFSLAVLMTAGAGLVLMSMGEQIYRDLHRSVLRASQDLGDNPPV